MDIEVCSCEDFDEQIKIINGYITLQYARTHKLYEGIPFIYCPWCGKPVKEDRNEA